MPPCANLGSSATYRIVRAVQIAICLTCVGFCPDLRAQIYRFPDEFSDDGMVLEQRADAFRDQVPLSGSLDNPLLPTEPPTQTSATFRPAWIQPDTTATSSAESGRQIRIRARGGADGIDGRRLRRGDKWVWVINVPTEVTIVDQDRVVALSADRIVAWTDQDSAGLGNLGANNAQLEFYLEGNIEFYQEGLRGTAERMYYDVSRQVGVVLEAEVQTQVRRQNMNLEEDFQTPFRVRAPVVQQFSPTQFQANDAAFTTSQMGYPRYWIESDSLSLDTGSTPLVDQVRQAMDGGLALGDLGSASRFERLQVTSQNSQIFVGGWPVFSWPTFSTDLARNPSLYLDRIRVGSDSVFGQQLLTSWNNLQLLGLSPARDIDWTTSIDYLSDRGLGFGTDLKYQPDQFLGRDVLGNGNLQSWFINDQDLDNLGQDRRAVPLERDFRGRVRGQHRHLTPLGWEVIGELGWVSDRNFLEQFYEEEWDLKKDQETRLELKRHTGSGSWSVDGSARLNDFFTQTEWLPRADHFEIGRALFANRLTWYEHSQIGYGRLRTADAPTNPVDSAKFDPLAWERNVEGIRAVTRQEIDWPVQMGALKVVPYVLGEAAYWQEDLNGRDQTRLLAQAGIRTSVPLWIVDPTVQHELFNLNGLAHKLVLDADFMWADASRDYLTLPLYDALDDDSVEFFRRRFLFDTFMGTFGDDVPLQFDERTFAYRSGLQRLVTSPSVEIADDAMMMQLRLRQRVQTKRGLPGRERIIDWFTFDVESTIFPRPERDNFGDELGPTMYDMRWHLGDRTTLLSDGYLDFFREGLRTVSLGAAISRPGRSQYYIGIRSIEGPISSNVLTSSVTYRLSPKWKVDYGSSVDLSGTGNIGQSARVVRIGESALIGLGAYYDASRNNLGLRFDIAPRFIRSSLGMIGGRSIPPVGAYGLE